MKWLLFTMLTPVICCATSYYVDPDYSGGGSTGAASAPWTAFSTAIWTNVDSSLSSNAVTVYLSALKADGTTQQSQGWDVNPRRRDYTANRLTIDGYSFYNANAASPNWTANPSAIGAAYTNGKVFKLSGGGSVALGWSRTSGNDTVTNGGNTYYCIQSHLAAAANEPGIGASWTNFWDQHGTGGSAWSSGNSYATLVKQDNVTFRGFEVTGDTARIGFSGDNFILEYVYQHDVISNNPAMALLYTSYPDNTNAAIIARPSVNMALQNFIISNTYGEALYLGSINPDASTNFQAVYGDQHSGLTISNFTIIGAGFYGAQGDAIDSKNGITRMKIVDGVISDWHAGGIIMPYSAIHQDQSNFVERVYFHDGHAGSDEAVMILTGGAFSTSLYGATGLTIRNCIIANSPKGIRGTGTALQPIESVQFYNNTIYNVAGTGIQLSTGATNCAVTNNFAFACGTAGSIGATGIGSDYNAHDGTWTSTAEGAHTLALSTGNALAAVANAPGGNFTLISSSPLRDAGAALSSFSNDFARNPRTGFWDIGAYELTSIISIGTATIANLVIGQ